MAGGIVVSLDRRLRASTGALINRDLPVDLDPAGQIEEIIKELAPRPDNARVWLLLTTVAAQFPDSADVAWARRTIELKRPAEVVVDLLSWASLRMSAADCAAEIEVVTDRTLVDVDFCARFDVSTGIQRVVRNLVSHWIGIKPVQLVRWVDSKGYVGLSSAEMGRVTYGHFTHPAPTRQRRLVPWRVSVVLPEVPAQGHGAKLAALAEFSSNRVNLVGHDCIPFVSADLVPTPEHDKFSEYIEVVKHAHAIAGVSRSASSEFAGFSQALAAQGLPGPRVVACPNAWGEGVLGTDVAAIEATIPNVICVSGLDRRKNQIAAIEAAEHLWRNGVHFSLELVGWGGARPDDVVDFIEELSTAGRPITVRREISDEALDEIYRTATVAVFPTRHEGFGLPVSEALSYGVPVVTSNFGSVREIAEGNGALLVDPEDPLEIAAALERVLTDPAVRADLRAEAAQRPPRSWAQYADEVWEAFS